MTDEATREAAGPTGAEFRRAEHLPAGYSPAWHAAQTLVIATAIGGLGLYLARRASALDWLFLPVFFLVANFVEWSFHRGPMHRPLTPRLLYKNHALLHHRAFEQDNFALNDMRELGLVMMPWYTMLLLFALVSPVALAGWWLRGPAVAGIFYLTAALYFLLYETLHALYHLPEPVLARLGLGGRAFRALQSHHRHHHVLGRMAHVNFNVTLPIMDTLLGTKEPEGAPHGAPLPAKR